MIVRLRITLFSIFFIFSFVSEVFASTMVNGGEDFRVFLSTWENSNSEQKIIDWNSFEEKYADVYAAAIFDHANENWPAVKEKALKDFFAVLPEIKNQMLTQFDTAEKAAQKNIASIKKVIPDFTDNLTFIFLPMALRLNAMETFMPSRRGEVVIVGVDAVVKWENDIDVLLTHELFHKHHFEKIYNRSAFTSVTMALWTEGLATYTSLLANPQADLATALYDKELATACENPEYVGSLAKKYLELYHRTLTDKERLELRRDWFWLNTSIKPSRPGYCLGYQVAKTIAKGNSLSEMISWGEMTFEDHVAAALKVLSK